MPIYRGPADFFYVGDKPYTRGDNVPLSKELVEHHRAAGHRFDDDGVVPGGPLFVPPVLAQVVPNVPMGDDGQPIQGKSAERAATRAESRAAESIKPNA